jgi:hypothetical protein
MAPNGDPEIGFYQPHDVRILKMSDDTLVSIDLTDDERDFMFGNLGEWGGPARGAKLLLPVIGLSTARELLDMAYRLGDSIRDGAGLSDLDWARALLLTEIAWGSNILGAGIDANTRGYDHTAVDLMRSIQYKVSSGERLRLLEQHVGIGADRN